MSGRGGLLPFAYRRGPVTVLIAIIYISLITTLVVIRNTVPNVPKDHVPEEINLAEAWHDLQVLTEKFHPYNSHANDEARSFLLRRVHEILGRVDGSTTHVGEDVAVVADDLSSNITFASDGASGLSVYFEGTNIVVQVKGTAGREDLGGVLVNAHYDSVSTGYGATDDGVGIITMLHLIKYFTSPAHRPKRDVLLLFNNGEEDHLNGARVFLQHPMSKIPRTFLNLEGAGAGGRAVLFRATDTEVTRFYKAVPYPFGSVLTHDGFAAGLIRSQTDYVIFNGDLGLRGLDVAFMEPRSRYHTTEDSVRYTSVDSVWNMISAAIATVEGIANDESTEFQGRVSEEGRVVDNEGSTGVWFDMFGRSFAVFQLNTLFGLSVSLLILAPLTLIVLTVLLVRQDKWYLFDRRAVAVNSAAAPGEGPLPRKYQVKGWYGFWRFPVTLLASVAIMGGFVMLTLRVNPLIVYSNVYLVWSELVSLFFVTFWFLSRIADFSRPSALVRIYTLLWLFVLSWAILVAVTVMENKENIAGGYFMVIYFASVFAATAISFVELFSLIPKAEYFATLPQLKWWREQTQEDEEEEEEEEEEREDVAPARESQDDQDADETSALLQSRARTSFQGYGSRGRARDANRGGARAGEDEKFDYFGDEQHWSGTLPKWTWILQILLLAPFNIILVGQLGLVISSSLRQTPADGNSIATIYAIVVVFSVLVLLPLTPFINRFTYHIPALLFAVAAGTILYNSVAFPFHEGSRLKVYFLQELDLDTGVNRVTITGLHGYTQQIVESLPSSNQMQITCEDSSNPKRAGLQDCSWQGLHPDVVPHDPSLPPEDGYLNYLTVHATQGDQPGEGYLTISGENTRACKFHFDRPLVDFRIVEPADAADDPRFARVGPDGVTELRLWRREWNSGWKVWVKWEGEGGLDGRAVCLWSDANDPTSVPALTEFRQYAPNWVSVSKTADGLVEGSKRFKL